MGSRTASRKVKDWWANASPPPQANIIRRPLRFFAILLFLWIFDGLELFLASRGRYYKLLLLPGCSMEKFRWRVGRWRALRQAEMAMRRVPALRHFVANRHSANGQLEFSTRFLEHVPITDKKTYISEYPLEDRLIDGVLPQRGVVVDESSGANGRPTNWARGLKERQMAGHMMRLTYASRRTRPLFIINAFSLGAWAAGMAVSEALSECAILKSIGPDLDKIVATMTEFGPLYNYVVLGYPPFLKMLADDNRIEWGLYTVDAGFGGEAITERMRSYLRTRFRIVLGSYGASDLGLSVAIETDLSIRLRQAIIDDKILRGAIVDLGRGIIPSIYQFNPMLQYIEVLDTGEIAVTLGRDDYLEPKIRYNIKDIGRVLRYPELINILAQSGQSHIIDNYGRALDLPLLLLYGRSDMSVEYFGTTLAPDAIKEAISATKGLAITIHSFKITSYDDEMQNKRLRIDLELTPGAIIPTEVQAIGDNLIDNLADLHDDFRDSLYNVAPKSGYPEVVFHEFQSGPFGGASARIKNRYI